MSKTSDFSSYSYIDSGFTGVLLDGLGLNEGDVLYVRSAANANSPSSAYVAVTVPAKATPPTALYDNPTHTLYGLDSTMDFRLGFPAGWSSWLQVTDDNSYSNVYPYLSTDAGVSIDVRYRNTPTVVQSMTIPSLAPAPAGLSLEWLDGVGLVLWGLENEYYYDFGYDSYFDNWYSTDGSYAGINITDLGLQPGDALYVRSAPSTSAATSACVELIVPAMSALARSAETIPKTDDADTNMSEIESIIDEIATIDLNNVQTSEGQKILLEDSEISTSTDDSDVQNRASAQAASDSGIGTLEVFSAESGNEPVLSPAE